MKEPLTVKEFLKKNLIFIIVLIAIFVVSILTYIIVFWQKLYDVSAWGSLVSGIFTYFGSSFLGIVVYFNTLSSQRQQEILNQISIHVRPLFDTNKEHMFIIPFAEEAIDKEGIKCSIETGERPSGKNNYVGVEIINRNPTTPIYIEDIKVYSVINNQLYYSDYSKMYSDLESYESLDYKQKRTIYIGSNEKFIRTDYYKDHPYQICFITFRITSVTGQVLYAIYEYIFGETLGLSPVKLISEDEYQRRMKLNNSPIIITKYHKQFFVKK